MVEYNPKYNLDERQRWAWNKFWELAAEKNWSAKETAKCVGVSDSTISGVKNGTYNADPSKQLDDLAAYFELKEASAAQAKYDGYVPTSISTQVYGIINNCHLLGGIRAVIDDDNSSLKIVAGNGEAAESQCVYNYTYEPLEISDEIKTQIRSGNTVTTNTKTFSAKLISKLYNASEELVFQAKYSSKGKITGFYDGDGKEIYVELFDLNIGENIGIAGADAPAIAWCMAKNSEMSNSLISQKKSYREGLDDSGADVTEDYSEDGSVPIEIDGSPENPVDKVTVPGITDMSDGVCYTFAADESDTEPAYYLRIYQDGETGVDMSAGGWWRYNYTSHLCYDLYDADGNLLSSNKLGYWYCKTWFIRYPNIYGYDWVSSVKITGDRWTVTRTRIPVNANGETGLEDTVTETGYLPIPGNSVVLSTSSSLPF